MAIDQAVETVAQIPDDFQPYRAICKSAVASLALGLLGLTALMSPVLLLLPALGVVLGLSGLAQIRRYPTELTGRTIGRLGAVGSAAVLLIAGTMHAVVYATEVPEGYQRINFDDLQPVPEARDLPVSPASMKMNDQKVFLKGYVYPDGQQVNIKRFVLVADLGTCCFGGQPKLTHMVEVTLRDPYRVEYSLRKLRLGGTLKVDTRVKPVSGLGGVYFQLDADYVR